MATILCLDDEAAVGVVLEHALQKIGHHPLIVCSVDDAMKTVERMAVDLIISDYRMPQATGIDLMSQLKKDGYDIPVIMMTGYSSIEHAVMSIKAGAIDYLTKPVRPETLEIAVNQALEVVRLRRENDQYRHEISSLRSRREIVGDSPSIRSVLDTLTTVAPTRATVLLEGESGTGKELFARFVHDQSSRHDKPFVSVNCAAMPEGLVESGLFGHEKGAFTGATARTAGAFERANGGTLMLDEISEMRIDLQAKLLRVIQEQEFERVGGQQPIKVDVRIVATTNRDLRKEVEKGRFREDLFYRLNVVPVHSPPLRDRRDDIPLLVRHFATRVAKELGQSTMAVAPETIQALQDHEWPGNVRELANAVERAVILSRGDVLIPDAFARVLGAPPIARAGTSGAGPGGSSNGEGGVVIPAGVFDLSAIEKIMIDKALEATGGNRTRAAKLLNISERTLRNKLNTKN
jgi:DNA-binding NtrC family response regulator